MPTVNILIYGKPGSGKTRLAATACDNPRMGGVLYCDVENGSLSIANRIRNKQLKVVKIRNVADLEKLGWKLANKENDKEAGIDYGVIGTVIIDTVNELQELDLHKLAEEEMRKPGTKRTSVDEPNLREFGIDTTRLKRVFRLYRDLDVNVIFLAHSKENKTDKGVVTDIVPALTTKVETVISSFVDFLWYLGQEGSVRKLATKPVGLVRAKTRGVVFPEKVPDMIENPDLGKIFDQIMDLEYGIKS